MSVYPVSARKAHALEERFKQLGILEADLRESFVRSSAAGGQNVNKVSTCVYLKHLPTGIEVKCQAERSQGLNRFLARRMLADKLEALRLGKASAARSEAEKIRRQKRRRSRRSREKMLDQKSRHSEKKEYRRRPPAD